LVGKWLCFGIELLKLPFEGDAIILLSGFSAGLPRMEGVLLCVAMHVGGSSMASTLRPASSNYSAQYVPSRTNKDQHRQGVRYETGNNEQQSGNRQRHVAGNELLLEGALSLGSLQPRKNLSARKANGGHAQKPSAQHPQYCQTRARLRTELNQAPQFEERI
jgi:hypothetical protein